MNLRIYQIALIIALLLCLLPMPYGYFVFVRFFAFVLFAVMAAFYGLSERVHFAVICGALSLLFQPFIKIALGREMWNIVDVLVAGLLVFFMYIDYKYKE